MIDSREPPGHSEEGEPAWLHAHVHEPNPDPPSASSDFTLHLPERSVTITVADLAKLTQCEVDGCYIVSTGHGTSGPFRFSGVRLADFVSAYLPAGLDWHSVDIVSADGFGNRVTAGELGEEEGERPILLATGIDGQPLSRAQGLVRLIVPGETDDALRQVKWIGSIHVRQDGA